ncbi:MAG: chromosome segregation protein SMC [Candidatus Omnitrophota bacterium]
MHFKELEIIGFKSFLNKTKLKFEPGVTAIVGPNGCGKSNVVDAVKWVLGEQSVKSMRSSAMQDVIFNGTDKQDPVNIAEVSFTLSNEDRVLSVDYDEVKITRRLYRSGESEYLLNKQLVRLTDIRNLIMGTGIGTSSYSVVEQGKMDMIISSKPDERRHIFEEASGITRYKSQKREALSKLERTQENLTRINDIIREVEKQINTIERKARKASRYKEKYEELKELDVKLAYRKFTRFSGDEALLRAFNDELKQTSGNIKITLEKASLLLGEFRHDFNGIFEEMQKIQDEATRLAADIDKGNHVIGVNNERIQELRKSAERLEWEIQETDDRGKILKERINDLETKFLEVRGNRADKEKELAVSEEEVNSVMRNLDKYRHELKFNRDRTVDMVSGQTRIQNTLIKIGADVHNARSREKRLKLEKNSVFSEKERVAQEMTGVEERLKEVSKELELKKKEFEGFNSEYITRQERLSVLENKSREKEKRINEIRPRRQFLEKLLEEREGVNEGVKKIMELAESGDERFSGMRGILSEIINVNDDYEESLVSVMGDIAQSLVVETKDTALRIVKYLEENFMESVNFIVLEELAKGTELSRDYESNGLKSIEHVLIAEEPYCSALTVLLRDVFVDAGDGSDNMYLADKNFLDVKVIGPKGTIFQKGARRSKNYSDKQAIPLFGRREKMEEMKKEEENINNELVKINARINEIAKWLKDSEAKKERLETERRGKEMEFIDISSKKTAVNDKYNTLSEEIVMLDTEIKEEESIIKQLQEEKDGFAKELEQLNAENAKIQQTVEMMQENIRTYDNKREKIIFSMADVKAELSAFRKEEENLEDNLKREKVVYEQMDRAAEEKRLQIKNSQDRAKELAEQTKSLEEKKLEYITRAEEKKRQIDIARKEKDELDRKIGDAEFTVKKTERELEETRDRVRDADIRIKELEYKKDSLIEKILETYKVDIRTVDLSLSEDIEWDGITSKVDEIKEQLEKMGEVSLGAVEEHKELEQRFIFLTTQREDLTKSREALLQAITKINRTTRKMFMETFEAIKKEFNNYFRMLFSGGKAELFLEDESNILECGIDIVVRPPGKKLHNIMQLSGGEKAMTAIALIFAIFKVNPSPFCILDEIDAPLDESNIVRFCSVLKEFIKLSQFVIVTHNRMTIQLADILYGITMQEKGISKLVSVKFAEEEEEEIADTETVPVEA